MHGGLQFGIDGRVGETVRGRQSSGTSETAYSNNRSATKCGWRMLSGRVGETCVKKGSPGSPETAYSNNR